MKKYIVIFLFFIAGTSKAQDSVFARKIVDTLTSPVFWGRGYTKDGMRKAAEFLTDQFKSFGLSSFNGNNYQQKFSYPVNRFPGRMEVFINDKKLIPGVDFIVSPESKGIHASGILKQADSTHFINQNYRFIASFEDKLTWSVAPESSDFTSISIDKKLFTEIPIKFQADLENEVIENFKTSNICGYVKGLSKPDSFHVITAHYDHLGGMGKETYFPGANDNASGVALLLTLAQYYALHPQPYSIVFICFAGEEAGLIGSKYFTENPLMPLSKIRFLVNLDLEGTGEEGITVVNATEFPEAYSAINKVNESGKYLHKINARAKAANSDHYWFTEKGVPAFFFYTLGGIKAYHDVFDRSATLPMNEYNDLFKLIVGFFGSFTKN